MHDHQPLRHPIRVLVADSSPITSQLLAEAIERDSRIEVLGFSSNPEEIAARIRSACPDVLLISARLEDEPNRGLVLLEQLRAERIAPKAVVLLDSRRSDLVVNSFRSGASGVFCRNAPFNMLCKCVSAVHDGQIWANSEELGFVLSALSASAHVEALEGPGLALLSKRERDVVRCLVEGQTNRQIAAMLGISQHTVKNYMFKIFDKLGVSNRVELVFQVLSRVQSQVGTGKAPRSDLHDKQETNEGHTFGRPVQPAQPKDFERRFDQRQSLSAGSAGM
jgi:DNA-binding NarL/FixJ family response regulator